MKFEPKPAVWTPDDLAQAGQALYGPNWQSQLARDIGVSIRSMQYMAAGARPVHSGIANDVIEALRKRTTELSVTMNELLRKKMKAEAQQD
jgi:hypothetical protein